MDSDKHIIEINFIGIQPNSWPSQLLATLDRGEMERRQVGGKLKAEFGIINIPEVKKGRLLTLPEVTYFG